MNRPRLGCVVTESLEELTRRLSGVLSLEAWRFLHPPPPSTPPTGIAKVVDLAEWKLRKDR